MLPGFKFYIMIPDYQKVMLPLLQFLGDGKPHKVNEAYSIIADYFNLTEEERNQTLPTSKKKILGNRIHWARAYLKMAGLIENTEKFVIQITDRGKQLVGQNVTSFDTQYLMDIYPDFKEKIYSFRYKKKKEVSINSEEIQKITETLTQTPEDLLNAGYQSIRKTLQEDLLLKLKSVSPSYFEEIVVDLLVKMGYGGTEEEASEVTRYTNDEGIDGIIKQDKLGLDVIYIQAKRWEGSVGRPEIQKFVGALAGKRAKKGVFITTSIFSKDAMAYAAQMDVKIILIDGEDLAQYMIDCNLGVSVQKTYEIKKIDSDYFEEE